MRPTTDPILRPLAAVYPGLVYFLVSACGQTAPLALPAAWAGERATLCAVGGASKSSCTEEYRSVPSAALQGYQTLSDEEASAWLARRPPQRSALFAQLDDQGHRLSLRQDDAGLTFHLGGSLTYFVANDSLGSPLAQLLDQRPLQLLAIAGHDLAASPQQATLRLDGPPGAYRDGKGQTWAALPFALTNSQDGRTVRGRLIEEPAEREITVASYNVENLFDQTDDSRNSSYGDYRITPNHKHQSSNYGEPVKFHGRLVTFTDVKIAGILETLEGLTPGGPDIVGLVEVESRPALDRLLAAARPLGYRAAQFTDWPAGTQPSAVGLGLLSKFEILDWALVFPSTEVSQEPEEGFETPRPILKVRLNVHGHPLLVYVNHWKSKSGPESKRIQYAEALARDLRPQLQENPRLDFMILGDLNSAHNEDAVIEPQHDDARGRTGINHVLKAQGNELAVARAAEPFATYNLHYELAPGHRRTAWHEGFGWSSLDHIIIGPGLYDQQGLTYVDQSFQAARFEMPRVQFLFRPNGVTNRWRSRRESHNFTRHLVGGYSDHLPIFARLRIAPRQSPELIPLPEPGQQDEASGKPLDFASSTR